MATTTPKRKPGRPKKTIVKSSNGSSSSSNLQTRFFLKKRWIFLIILLVAAFVFNLGNINGRISNIFHGSLTDVSTREVGNDAPINAITQAKQSIMVLPSDLMLQKCGALTTTESMGKMIYKRDYQKFLLSSSTNQQVINTLQESFTSAGYSLVNLEQSLKSLENQSLFDVADGVAKDAKTMLLSTARPDIIIEFDYDVKTTAQSRDAINRTLSYNITLLDAFTNKAIGSISDANVAGFGMKDDPAALLKEAIGRNTSKLSNQVKSYFKDILKYGREITFTVAISSSSSVTLQDMCNSNGDTYADWIREWVKTNAKRGAATMQRNTQSELHFVDVRIENVQDDGTQYNAYDFADDFRKEFYRTFNIQASNNTQGLAGAYLLIK